ncbi:Restriction of telomere capping protein 4 [Spathaspora sp. JA1]|nr:Restriction of telomere capping protein 4 [Spathaspora sp. JA1]
MGLTNKKFGSLDRSHVKKGANPIGAPTLMFSPKRSSEGQGPSYKKRKKNAVYVHQSEPSSSNQISQKNVLESSIAKSAGSLYPTIDSSDDDEGMIDIEKLLSASPPKAKSEGKSAFVDSENHNKSNEKRKKVSEEPESSESSESSDEEVILVKDVREELGEKEEDEEAEKEEEEKNIKPKVVPEDLDNSTSILKSLSGQSQSKIDSIKRKYKGKGIPNPIVSRKSLIERSEKHLTTVTKILRGKHPPSFYYELAKKQKENSIHETMGSVEKWKVNWESYYGGYYGLKRQSIIGTLIQNRLQQQLKRSVKTNRTVSYWTIPRFCTYVLANEIIIRMIMEDMNCDFDEAEEIIRTTTDYGIVVADSVEVEFDLENSDDDSSSEEQQPSTRKTKDALLDKILSL